MNFVMNFSDKQEIYNTVKAHLLKQNAKSVRRGAWCAYRGNKGMMCAAGVLIPDAIYNPRMEGRRWTDIVNEFELPDTNKFFIHALQKIHDGFPPSAWEHELSQLAEAQGLTP